VSSDRPAPSQLRPGLLAGLVAAALLAATAGAAKEPAGEASAVTAPAEKSPEAIPLPEISLRSEQVAAQLRRIGRELEAAADADASERTLSTLAASDRALVERTDLTLRQGPQRRVVDALDDAWRARRGGIAKHEAAVAARAAVLEAEIQDLVRQREVWRLTAEQAGSTGAPPALKQRAESTLAAIAATQQALERRRASLLDLQARVVGEIAVADTVLEEIEKYRKEVLGRLLVPDRRPIWHTLRSGASAGEALAGAVADLSERWLRLREYLALHPARFAAQFVLFALLAWLFRSARGAVLESIEAEPDLSQAAVVFHVPISAALLLALVASPWLHTQAPSLVPQLAALAALLPVLRILRRLVDRTFARGLSVFAAFYAVDRVRDVLSTSPLVEQVLFLLEMLAGIALMAWLLRPKRLAGVALSGEQGAALRPLGVAVRLLLASFVVAFVSGALGYFQLGRLLGAGALSSTYAALALFAALRAAEGLLAFALRVRPLRLLRLLSTHRPFVRRRVQRTLRWAATATWLLITLQFLGVLDLLLEAGRWLLGASLTLGALTLSLDHVFAFAITVAAAFLLSRFLRFVLEEDVYPRLSLARGVPYAISSVLHYTLLFGGFVLAISALGVDLNRFTILAGAFGVGIGFGLQNVVNNFVSGLIILVERPIQVSDTVQLGELIGTVERVGIRSSTVRTWEGAEVIVPNASLISEQLTNWTLSNRRRRIDVRVGVAYGTDPNRMIELLLSVARANRETLAFPAPVALFLGFGDSSLDFELRAWTDDIDQSPNLRSELNLGIHRALAEAGIEVPFPQRVVRLKREG
jgi:small-conductance mechanosensitive channel